MSDVIAKEHVQLLQKTLGENSLQFFLKSNWGQNHTNYRENILQALSLQLGLTDTSISHSLDLGGFAGICNNNKKIGFDVELFDRVTAVIAKRVCANASEFNDAPSAAHLWVAKESAFKALKGENQPKVLSEIAVHSWQKKNSQIETFKIKSDCVNPNSESIGVTFLQFPFIFGVFLFLA